MFNLYSWPPKERLNLRQRSEHTVGNPDEESSLSFGPQTTGAAENESPTGEGLVIVNDKTYLRGPYSDRNLQALDNRKGARP